jgi:amino acid transporter
MKSPDGVAAPALLRRLRRIDVIALTVNVTIGAGVLAMPAGLAASAGRWSILVLLAAFALTALLALSLVEVASRFDVTGGPPVYAGDAFGSVAGFSVGWLLGLSRAVSFAAISQILLDYLVVLAPALDGRGPRLATMTAFVLVLVVFNIRGVTRGALLSNLLTVAKLLPLLPLAFAGLWLAGWNHVPAEPPAMPDGITKGLALALFACFGFEQAGIVAGEMRDPRRDIAPAILIGIGIVCVVYLLLVFAAFALLPDPATSTRPLADAAEALVGPAGAIAIAIAAVFSCAGSMSATMLVAPRLFFALGERGDLPRVLAAVHAARRTPHVAIVLLAIIAWLLAVSGTFEYLITLFVIIRVVTYGSVSAALIRLRRRDGAAPVTVPGGYAIAVAALLCVLAITLTTSWQAVWHVAIALAVGLAIRAATRYAARVREPHS